MSDTTLSLPSGRFVLRIEPEHHAVLRDAAEECGLSLNEYCARKLAAPGANVTGPSAHAIRKVVDAVGDALVGIVAFGSWARREMTDISDVDLLVIVEDRLPIRRDLYREWDASPLSWDSHRVEPHFVHLPSPEDDISGLWAEAAVDGVVLFERDLRISRRLVEIRREIVAGRIERRECHGHPYWVRAA
ncbi:MAG: toxin-antitoxin system HicB family antitoxin [Gemmatimonadetes bacterium]|nr:toxin-antitoxin system HicB family antitoxin [Gemmatimonadota bacterium]NIU31565.1 toxin-antitoxin system HicB family antitoxin [Gemmatimonadota bacterium]NIU36221.1 toxin-antitoxin system HicB family antitoxin [Gemmatimonadota bacterium]NIV83122.1 toxin-antitoxin system HicB family antitoxin [Gemmatimonadota bacterium]NIW64646.1 toxin-antitoxin system HicB family antitoxin [Gemmatimonadota bacterium]